TRRWERNRVAAAGRGRRHAVWISCPHHLLRGIGLHRKHGGNADAHTTLAARDPVDRDRGGQAAAEEATVAGIASGFREKLAALAVVAVAAGAAVTALALRAE